MIESRSFLKAAAMHRQYLPDCMTTKGFLMCIYQLSKAFYNLRIVNSNGTVISEGDVIYIEPYDGDIEL